MPNTSGPVHLSQLAIRASAPRGSLRVVGLHGSSQRDGMLAVYSQRDALGENQERDPEHTGTVTAVKAGACKILTNVKLVTLCEKNPTMNKEIHEALAIVCCGPFCACSVESVIDLVTLVHTREKWSVNSPVAVWNDPAQVQSGPVLGPSCHHQHHHFSPAPCHSMAWAKLPVAWLWPR